jgi:hypothetical protein
MSDYRGRQFRQRAPDTATIDAQNADDLVCHRPLLPYIAQPPKYRQGRSSSG